MSLELALEKLADAINNHAEALRETAGKGVAITNNTDSVKKFGPPDGGAKPEETKEPSKEPSKEEEQGSNEPTLDDVKNAIQAARSAHDDDFIRDTMIAFGLDAAGKKQFGRLVSALDVAKYQEFLDALAKGPVEKEPEQEEEEDDLLGDLGGDEEEEEEVTLDDLRQAFGSFLKIDDSKERGSRKVFVSGILQKLGGSKVTELPEDKWGAAMAELKKYKPA